MEVKEHSKYWDRIKANIKRLKKEGKITKRYNYDSFCNNFIPDLEPLQTSITNKCMCDHGIVHNFKYTHKDRDDMFIMGSCCIKKFSTVYKEFRECKICNNKIKKNKENLCKQCKEKEKERLLYIEKCKCEGCGYIKKDDKYKYCFKCKNGGKEMKHKKCKECGKDKKEDTYMRCYSCNTKSKFTLNLD
jgi:hypothetical protein